MIEKYLTVKKLKEILEELDDTYLLTPNQVRNIIVASSNKKYLGYIDFLEGTYDVLSDDLK